MTLPAADAQMASLHAGPSAARKRGAIFDWAFFIMLALMVWAAVVLSGSGVLRVVQTAVEAPLRVVAAASTQAAQQGSDHGYIEHTEWTTFGNQPSLRVYPTAAGRQASGGFVDPDEAWAEVLTVTPGADMPGMRQQFVCHWWFAELADPGKVSWNLEPWRPVVNGAMMIESGCNPGGTEEQF